MKVEEIVVEGKHVFAIEVPEVPGVTATSDGLHLRRRLKPNGKPETVPMNPFGKGRVLGSGRTVKSRGIIIPTGVPGIASLGVGLAAHPRQTERHSDFCGRRFRITPGRSGGCALG